MDILQFEKSSLCFLFSMILGHTCPFFLASWVSLHLQLEISTLLKQSKILGNFVFMFFYFLPIPGGLLEFSFFSSINPINIYSAFTMSQMLYTVAS